MLRALKAIFLSAVIAISAYWLLTVVDDVYRAGALGMVHLRDGGTLAMLIYVALAELWRGSGSKAKEGA